MGELVTVTVPYFGCPTRVRRAVESILAQRDVELRCVVVNDGDHRTPPWPRLEHITDRRLLRFELPDNRGRYFVDAVCVAALDGGWWSPHDADDWSEPTRLATLLQAAADRPVVLGAHINHYRSGATVVREVKPVGQRMRYRIHLSGLWRPQVAGALTHPGWRIEWAAAMTSAALLTGYAAVVQQPLYHRVLRRGSLVTDPATGHRSPYRVQQRRRMRRLWRRMVAAAGSPAQLTPLAAVVAADVNPRLRGEVSQHAARLRNLLEVS